MALLLFSYNSGSYLPIEEYFNAQRKEILNKADSKPLSEKREYLKSKLREAFELKSLYSNKLNEEKNGCVAGWYRKRQLENFLKETDLLINFLSSQIKVFDAILKYNHGIDYQFDYQDFDNSVIFESLIPEPQESDVEC